MTKRFEEARKNYEDLCSETSKFMSSMSTMDLAILTTDASKYLIMSSFCMNKLAVELLLAMVEEKENGST